MMKGIYIKKCRQTCIQGMCYRIFSLLFFLATISYGGVSIAIRNIDIEAGTLDIYIVNDVPIAGFQFHMEGISITSASGGLTEEPGFMLSASSTSVLGFSLTSSTIPEGEGVLLEIGFSDYLGGDILIGTDGVDPPTIMGGNWWCCHGDLNGDNVLNVLDIVILANCVLAGNCDGRVDDATESRLIMNGNIVSIEADGFIGGVQMTLTHGDDFTIDMTDRALLADYITKGNETRLLVITPETDELFSFEGDFEIAEIIVANSHAEVSVDDLPLAVSFSLSDAYPNPFNPATTMKLVMPVAGDIQVEVYNLLGQVVATLTSGYRDAGTYNLTWDATDVASGMYFVKAQADGFTKTQKLMLIK